jgi:hypothetical protein
MLGNVMAAELFLLPFRPALDANAIVVPGAKLYFYASGTSTPQAIYADEALTTPLANPVQADAAGAWPTIYLNNSLTYRVLMKDADGNTLPNTESDPYIPGVVDALAPEIAANAALSSQILDILNAIALGIYYPSTAAGITGTDDGEFFGVVISGRAYVYLNDSGTAVLQWEFATLQQVLDTLAASGGAALVGYGNRPVSDSLPLTPQFYGAVGDGATNDTAAFSAFFAAGGGFVPAGTYLLSATPTAPTGNVAIEGEEGATLLIAHGGTRALHFTPAAANNTVTVTGLTLQAGYASGPCPLGIDIEFPSAASFPYEQVSLDVKFKGDLDSSTAPWANTWARGVRLKNVWYPSIKVIGSSYPDLGNTGSTGAVEIVGGSYGCVGGKFELNWYYGAVGILGSAYMEGCTLLPGSELVNVTRGWYIPSSTPLGGFAGASRGYALVMDNAHIAAWVSAVDMDTVIGLRSNGCDIQRSASASATNWKGYDFNQCQRPQIIGGVIGGNEADAGVTTVGIEATGANSAHGIVNGVSFENLDIQFSLDANTTSWTIVDNRATGATSDVYSLLGSKHKLEWLKADGSLIYTSDQLNGPIMAGAYTPTLTGVVNVAASGAYSTIYYRVGNMVTVSGLLDLDPTASATYTRLGISLPVASNLVATQNCCGVAGSGTQGVAGQIVADITNDRAELQVLPNTDANHGYSFTFTYQVI